MRKFLKIGLILLGFLLLLAILLPYFYKSRIIEAIKYQANKSINGRLEFLDAQISILRAFPNLSISIEKVVCQSFANKDTTEIFKADEIQIGLNLWKVLTDRNNTVISTFHLEKPYIHFIQFDSLYNNALIFVEDSLTTKSESNTSLQIKKYSIKGGTLYFEDRFEHTKSLLDNIDHSGQIIQSNDILELNSNTAINAISFHNNGIPVFENLSLNSLLNLKYQENISKFQIQQADINLNNLKLSCQGAIQMLKDSIVMDLKLESPSNEFKDLFSILPNAFTADYKSVESSGRFAINASVNGIYSSLSKIYPTWDLSCLVENGSLKYPDKQVKLQDVNLDIKSSNADPLGNAAYINVNKLNFDLNNQKFSGIVLCKNIFNNPKFSGNLIGLLSLTDLNAFYPMAKESALSGKVNADLTFDFSENVILEERYSAINLAGFINFDQITYQTKDQPTLGIYKGKLLLSPENLLLTGIDLAIGKSDIQLDGKWSNPLKIFTKEPTVNLSLTSTSRIINMTEWLTIDTSNEISAQNSIINAEDLKGIEISFNSSIKKLVYPEYDIQNISGFGKLIGDQLVLDKIKVQVNGNKFDGSGTFNNVAAYTFEDKVLYGKLKINADQFDADLFLKIDTTMQTSQVSAIEPFQIPNTFNFDILCNVNKFIYRPLKMNNVKGQLAIIDSDIQFHDLNSNALGGKMFLNGVFSTKDPNAPSFNMKYDLSKVYFSDAFNSLLSVKKLAPVMQYIQGFFNSNIIIQGNLDNALNPIFESINVDGFIETLEGSIKGFKPLEQLANKLNMSELKNFNLKNTKNWLTVKNGFVELKDFNKSIDDIGITIGGNHKINGEMDYRFLFKIPKSKMDRFSKTIQLEKNLEKLSGVLSKAGINGLNSKSLNILVSMKGGLTDPKIGLKWVNEAGADQNAESITEDIKNNIKDTLSKRAEQEIDKLKNKANKALEKYEDSLKVIAREKANQYKDEVLNKVIKDGGKIIDSNLILKAKEVLKNPLDSLLKPGDKVNVDDIKNKMKDWNPFKKEKK